MMTITMQPTLTPVLDLSTSLEAALGDANAQRLAGLGLHTVEGLITHWPRKWRERGEEVDLALVPDGERATVRTVIQSADMVPLRNNPKRKFLSVDAITSDGRKLKVSLFAAWQARKDGIVPGAHVTFSGQVKSWRGKQQMSNPEYALTHETSDDFAGKVVPVYPATASASSDFIAEQVASVLDRLEPGSLADPIPASVLLPRELPSYAWSIHQIHRPDTIEDAERARKRLTYDEAFAVQLALAVKRHGSKAAPSRALPGCVAGLRDQFDASLPFSLTAGQAKAGATLDASMSSTKATNALVLGDVGAGKTIVALRAMLRAVDSGAQAAFVAPTEVLAVQHFQKLTSQLSGLDVTVELLVGRTRSADRARIEAGLRDGSIHIVVGTHALTTGTLEFDNLGLVVIDEQHRFGVAARDALRAQPVPPHMVVMTATPIPRTLAMTVYGDLEVVELEGLPGGRQPIATHVVPLAVSSWIERLWQRIGEEVAAGRQAMVVASRIDNTADDETVDTDWADDSAATTPAASVDDLAAMVAEHLPHVRSGVLHGRMAPAEKSEVMDRFVRGEIDVLVSTTVIEVGVDVPNATVMAVWDADRFGIAQLHQLRGRVGRGQHKGLCLLVTSQGEDHSSRQRLDLVAETTDGHKLSLADLKARREGDILGTGQAGRSRFKLLDLTSGQRLIAAARKDAEQIVKADPALRSSVNRPLAAWLSKAVGEDAAANLVRA